MIRLFIIFFIFFLHLLVISLIQTPEKNHKKLIVKEYRPSPKKKKILTVHKESKKAVSKKSEPKKIRPKKKVIAKKKNSSEQRKKAQSTLEKALNDWEDFFSSIPEEGPSFSSDIPPEISLQTKEDQPVISPSYQKSLLNFLRDNITLPHKGITSVKIILLSNGKIKHCEILSSSNQENSAFLKKHLPSLSFPCFNDSSQEKTFTIHISGK